MTTPALEKPLRTRERAALDIARAALRTIMQSGADSSSPQVAANALERIATVLGER